MNNIATCQSLLKTFAICNTSQILRGNGLYFLLRVFKPHAPSYRLDTHDLFNKGKQSQEQTALLTMRLYSNVFWRTFFFNVRQPFLCLHVDAKPWQLFWCPDSPRLGSEGAVWRLLRPWSV